MQGSQQYGIRIHKSSEKNHSTGKTAHDDKRI